MWIFAKITSWKYLKKLCQLEHVLNLQLWDFNWASGKNHCPNKKSNSQITNHAIFGFHHPPTKWLHFSLQKLTAPCPEKWMDGLESPILSCWGKHLKGHGTRTRQSRSLSLFVWVERRSPKERLFLDAKRYGCIICSILKYIYSIYIYVCVCDYIYIYVLIFFVNIYRFLLDILDIDDVLHHIYIHILGWIIRFHQPDLQDFELICPRKSTLGGTS